MIKLKDILKEDVKIQVSSKDDGYIYNKERFTII